MKNPRLLATALVAASLAAAPAAAQGGDLLVEASRIVLSPDRTLDNSAILIRNGKVAFVGDDIPGEAKRRAKKVKFKGTVVPGFINSHTALGHGNNLRENIDAFTPELMASDAFDPFIKDNLRAARAGVTAAALAPLSTNIVAGQASVVRTGKIGRVARDASYVKFALVRDAFDQNRYPTSRMGAADMIRNVFKQASSPLGATNDQLKVLRDISSGARRMAIHANTQAEITMALDLCQELKLQPVLMGCTQAHRCLDRLATAKATLVLAPLSLTSSKQRLTLPGQLDKRALTFSFMAERAIGLRLTAALAVRYGCSRKTAMAALTTSAAQLLEVQDQVGTLFQGRHADFAVYSADPLDLSSRLQAVYVAGKPVELGGTKR